MDSLRQKAPVIIDEIERVPKIVSKIQIIVDSSDVNGLFILTGSFQQSLKSSRYQLLAGRTAILNLLPLSISELKNSGIDLDIDEYLY